MFKGTAIAQIIAVIGAIYLAKIYGEEAYGFLGVFISIISISSIISTLQLDNCIIISKDEKESIHWLNFLLLLVPLITIILFCFFYFVSNYFLDREHTILLTILGAILIPFNLLYENFFTFKKEFSIISTSKIFTIISKILLQLFLFTYYNLLGLIIGYLISQLLLLIYFFYKNNSTFYIPKLNEIKKGIRKNSSIIKFLLPSNIISSLATNLMPILILAIFGAKEAGVYFFSIKILGMPLFLISSSVSQVFYQKSSELYKKNKKELLKLTKKIVKTNLLIMLVLLILINTLGIYVLEIFFDKNWSNLRLYTLILSILIFARASYNPISSLIVVIDKNHMGLIFNTYLFIINIIAIYFGYLYNSIIITILILAIFGGIGYITLFGFLLKYLKKIATN